MSRDYLFGHGELYGFLRDTAVAADLAHLGLVALAELGGLFGGVVVELVL